MTKQCPLEFSGHHLYGPLFAAQVHFADEIKDTYNQRYIVKRILEQEFRCRITMYRDRPGRPPKMGRQFDIRDVHSIKFNTEEGCLDFKARYLSEWKVVKLNKRPDTDMILWLRDNVGALQSWTAHYQYGLGWRAFLNGEVNLLDSSDCVAFCLTFNDEYMQA